MCMCVCKKLIMFDRVTICHVREIQYLSVHKKSRRKSICDFLKKMVASTNKLSRETNCFISFFHEHKISRKLRECWWEARERLSRYGHWKHWLVLVPCFCFFVLYSTNETTKFQKHLSSKSSRWICIWDLSALKIIIVLYYLKTYFITW